MFIQIWAEHSALIRKSMSYILAHFFFSFGLYFLNKFNAHHVSDIALVIMHNINEVVYSSKQQGSRSRS